MLWRAVIPSPRQHILIMCQDVWWTCLYWHGLVWSSWERAEVSRRECELVLRRWMRAGAAACANPASGAVFFFLSTQSGPKSHPPWLAGARTPIASPRPAAGTANRLTTKTLLRCELSQPVHHLVRLRFNYTAIVLRYLNLFKQQFVVFTKTALFLET